MLGQQRMIWLDNRFNGHEFEQTAGDSDGQVPLYCGGSSLWVWLDGWLVKVSWLGKLVLVFLWVELDFFSLECNEESSSELRDVSGFGVTLGSLYIEAQGCVPVLLENLCGMSSSETCWPLCGAWFQCRYGGV